jgi:hypothetical protein
MGSSFIWTVVKPYFVDEGKEVIALVALMNNHKHCSMAFHLVSLLRHLKQERWLTKSIVLMIPLDDHGRCGVDRESGTQQVEEWLSMFNGDVSLQHQHGVMPLSGIIRAALAIQTNNSLSGNFDIRLNVVGSEGRLPNMDLPNLVAHSFHHNVVVEGEVISNRFDHQSYSSLFHGLISMIHSLLMSSRNVHGVFLDQGIDAVTIELIGSEGRRQGSTTGLETVLRNIESVVRSLNMAEQKLTHGFFLYSFMTSRYFVSIGEFSITVVLVVACFAFISLGSFVSAQSMLPSMQLFVACFATSLVCSSIGLFDSIEHGSIGCISILLVGIATRLVIKNPCRNGTLFIVSTIMLCLNATHIFRNIAMALVGPLIGIACCCTGLLCNYDGRNKIKFMCGLIVWLVVAALVLWLVTSMKCGFDLFLAALVCHITTLLSSTSSHLKTR